MLLLVLRATGPALAVGPTRHRLAWEGLVVPQGEVVVGLGQKRLVVLAAAAAGARRRELPRCRRRSRRAIPSELLAEHYGGTQFACLISERFSTGILAVWSSLSGRRQQCKQRMWVQTAVDLGAVWPLSVSLLGQALRFLRPGCFMCLARHAVCGFQSVGHSLVCVLAI